MAMNGMVLPRSGMIIPKHGITIPMLNIRRKRYDYTTANPPLSLLIKEYCYMATNGMIIPRSGMIIPMNGITIPMLDITIPIKGKIMPISIKS